MEWGLRVEQQYGVRHVDNTASHLGLDTAAGLIRKYGTSGDNFARLISLHPDEMRRTPLYRSARLLGGLPVTGAVERFTKWIALAPGWLLPSNLRLLGLKLYRATVYGRSLRHG